MVTFVLEPIIVGPDVSWSGDDVRESVVLDVLRYVGQISLGGQRLDEGSTEPRMLA